MLTTGSVLAADILPDLVPIAIGCDRKSLT
jgi:hypothetical protein